MLTIDASVHINALNPNEPDSVDSQALLAYLRQNKVPIYNPTLLLVEVAASIARQSNNSFQGVAMAQAIRNLPGQAWITLDNNLANATAKIAAFYRLRGADAVYAAVAQRYKTTLVSLDNQQLQRLSQTITVQNPKDALHILLSSK